jgi:Zn-finger nucleic acid-binding protein
VYREWTRPSAFCPRCHRALQEVGEEEAVYETCPCGGVFATPTAFAQMWVLMSRQARSFAPIPPLLPRPRIYSLPCPRCQKAMRRADLLGVPLDVCDRHGLWFDSPELEMVLMAAALPFHHWLRRYGGRIRQMR